MYWTPNLIWGTVARPRELRRLLRARNSLLSLALAPALAACGDDGASVSPASGNGARAERSAGTESTKGRPGTYTAANAPTGPDSPIRVPRQAFICISVEVGPGLPGDINHENVRRGFTTIIIRALGERLDALAIPRNRPGDTTGERFRMTGAPGGEECSGPDNVGVSVRINAAAGDGRTPPPGRPAIAPYMLELAAQGGGGQWRRTVTRRGADAHPSVTRDPRTSSLPSATEASIVHDLAELSEQLGGIFSRAADE
jgi:hypothetical protein